MSDHKQDGVSNDQINGSQHEVESPPAVDSSHSSQSADPKPSRIRSDEVLDLIASVETQLEQMRTAQSDRVGEIETLESRRNRISEQELQLEERGRGLERSEQELQGRLSEFETQASAFEQRAAAFESSRNQYEADVEKLDSRASDLDRHQAQIDEMMREIDDRRASIDSSLSELENDRTQFESERSAIDEGIRDAQASVSAYENRCGELEQEVSELRSRHDELAERLKQSQFECTESQKQHGDLRDELNQFRSDSLDLSAKLESAASVIEGQEQQIESARSELQSIESERDSALRTIAERDQELSQLQSNLELAMNRLQSLATAVSEQGPQLEEGAAAIALCRSQQERLESLSTELEDARSRLADPDLGDLDATMAAAREEIDRLRTDLEDSIPIDEHNRVVAALENQVDSAASVSGLSEVDENAIRAQLAEARAEVQVLQAHAAACEDSISENAEKLSELQARNEALENVESIPTDGLPEDALRLREQAQRLSSFALHLQRRRGRLNAVRSALRVRGNQPSSDLANDAEKTRVARAEQEELLRRRHELSDLESQMMRRWACHGSIGSVVRVTMLLVLIAAASWFGVRFFSPGTVTTTALVRAQPVAGGALDSERGEAWNQWHEMILKDPIFTKMVAERLAASPAGFTGGADRLAGMLASQLTVTATQPGLLQLRLNGTSRAESTRILQNVVTALASESQRQLPRRGDSARAEVIPSDGRLITMEPIPVTGQQIQTAGFVFGGSVVGIGLLGAGIYSRLRRSKRLFDQNMGLEDTYID